MFSGWMLELLGNLLALSHCFLLLYDLQAPFGFSLESLLRCSSCSSDNLSLVLYDLEAFSGFSMESRLHYGSCAPRNPLISLCLSALSDDLGASPVFLLERLLHCF